MRYISRHRATTAAAAAATTNTNTTANSTTTNAMDMVANQAPLSSSGPGLAPVQGLGVSHANAEKRDHPQQLLLYRRAQVPTPTTPHSYMYPITHIYPPLTQPSKSSHNPLNTSLSLSLSLMARPGAASPCPHPRIPSLIHTPPPILIITFFLFPQIITSISCSMSIPLRCR